MKVTVSQESLAQGLSAVGRAVAARSTMPVLGNILLATDEGRLKLAATNLELCITEWTDAKIDENGAVTVPAKLLSDVVGSLPKGEVGLNLNIRNQTLNVRSAAFETNLRGIDSEEFPPIPQVSDAPKASVEPKALQEAISQVAFAAATDDTRPALTGVLLSFQAESLTLAAADGFRLAVRTIPSAGAADEALNIIVPARAMQELARALPDTADPITISVTSNRNHVLFRLKDSEIVSRLIEATFPDYRKIIPTGSTTQVIANTKEMQSATKLASFFVRDSVATVKLQIKAGEEGMGGSVVVSASATDVGDTQGMLTAAVQGEDAQIGFNAKYLSDVLSAVGTAQMSLELSSPSRPGLFRPVGNDSYTHVIMPMHTR